MSAEPEVECVECGDMVASIEAEDEGWVLARLPTWPSGMKAEWLCYGCKPQDVEY